MSKNRSKNPQGLYHIYNRGNNKENIFLDSEDKYKFLLLVKKYCSIYNILIYAYCIMLNHYHLFTDDKYGSFSDCMRDIQARYAEYYNDKYERSGHVFQGPFGSCEVMGLKYVIDLIRYILRNPVKAGIVDSVWNYDWSSLGKSNSVIGVVDNNFVEVLFQNANCNFSSYIESNVDDHIISELEKQRYKIDEAKAIYNKLLHKITKENINEFSILNVDIKLMIIMECRYVGITINQLKELTGETSSFIRRANPRDMRYL